MDALTDLRIVDGPVALVCWILGGAGALALAGIVLSRQPRRRGPWFLVAAAAVSAVLTLSGHWFMVEVASVLPSDLPSEVLAWIGVAVFGVALGAAALARIGRARAGGLRILAVISAAAVALLAGQQVNAYFGLNVTLGDLAGSAVSRVEPLDATLERNQRALVPLDAWRAPEGLAQRGEVRRVQIPNPASGFPAREAFVYFPPAYLVDQRPELPVLVLMAGQPGGPADWLTGGQLRGRMDRFAAAHDGVAPVVVVVDPIASPGSNTLCMDTKLGQAESYLVQDVVPWIKDRLSVARENDKWAAGGFSFGATCAVQLLAKHPETFSAALAFAAEKEPALAKERQKTVDAAFDGDTAAFDAQLPAHFFALGGHEGQYLFLATGSKDSDFTAQAHVIAGQARGGGVHVDQEVVEDEGHSWEMIDRAMPTGLERLASRWGIR